MKKTALIKKIGVLIGYLLPMSAMLNAQDKDEDRTLSPYFVVVSDNPELDQLPLKETSADVNIVGSIADVTVRQVYVNSGKNPLEAIYTFPMSTRAAVYGMQMTIGQRRITAKIEEKKKARADYEQAKQEGKRASLLEQSRPNVFTMNVSNIMAGDTIVVELNYTELLVPERGVYSFVYPTVVGPRYSKTEKSKAGPDDQFVGSPYTHEGVMPTYTFDFRLSINSGIPIQDITCNTHKMNTFSHDLRHATLTLDPNEKQGGNRDVIVTYSLQGSQIESGVMLYEGADENFFLAMVQPPKRVAKEDIPPREYIFIVDVSGSMWGFPMEITKKLMQNLIVGLRPTDKFNVVLFSSNADVFSPASVNATPENMQRAVNFIKSANKWSSTEVLDALKTAYALPLPDEDMARTMVIATDGYVTVEKACFEMVRQNSGKANFFAFGIGSSVNRYMIDGMAFAGGGEPFVVTHESEAKKAAERFRQYISTPVLTRIKFNAKGFEAYDVEPVASPDMMAERPILIFGKYKGQPQGSITLTGKVGRKAWKQSFNLSDLKAESTNSALRYLWARERIKYYDYLVGEYANEEDPYAKKILDLGLKYNLMTNYTSFVAIDEVVVNKDGKPTTVKQPLPMPEGVSDYAVGHDMASASIVKMKAARTANTAMPVLGVIGDDTEIMEEAEEEIFVIVEEEPEFPGGMDSLYAFLARNIKYPEDARSNNISGTVIVKFTIEKDGSVTNIKLLHDIGGGCGNEAVRVVRLMPKWKPGKQSGKAVRCEFTLPIAFQL
ncbi:MAG: TonB family protein [Bacteroidales bacterium]|nr:TonB family protein [Bacteroidales bacterium]